MPIQPPPLAMRGDLKRLKNGVRDEIAKEVRQRMAASTIGANIAHILDVQLGHLKGERMACRKGCAWCCYHPVGLTVPEAVLIATALRDEFKDEPATLEGIRAALIEHAERTKTFSSPDEYRRAKVPCPFLTDAGECAIYEFRPLVCRGHRSLDANDCRTSHDDVDFPVSTDMAAVYVVGATIAGMVEAFVKAKRDPYAYAFAPLLLAALDDPELGEKWAAKGTARVALPVGSRRLTDTVQEFTGL